MEPPSTTCSFDDNRRIARSYAEESPPRTKILYLVSESVSTTLPTEVDLLGRIGRLESLLLPKHSFKDGHITRDLEPNPSSEEVITSGVHQGRDKDLHLLENIGMREDSLLHSISTDLAVQIRSTQGILSTQGYLQHPASTLEDPRSHDTIRVTFPPYEVSVLLLENYVDNVDHVCRILHIPTVRSLLKTFYLRMSQDESVLPGQAALLLSLFALSAFFYEPALGSEVPTTGRDAVRLSKFWSSGALDVLDHSQRNTSGTLEDLQAVILMTYVTKHLDGYSARARLLTTTAISIARDLRLHRLDAENEPQKEQGTSIRALVDLEVKRRIFWHIAASDWWAPVFSPGDSIWRSLLIRLWSTISGPQEGVYFIHPNHIHINLPSDCNCNGDEMALDDDDEATDASQPASKTFFLARVRLAHICREMTDTVPLGMPQLRQIPYEQIITLDQKLTGYISNLPVYFRLDAESRRKSKPLEALFPHIPMMRYCISTAAHTRRCRLHQRFLLRQSSDARYAYSRQACLESARAVIAGYEAPQAAVSGGSSSIATARMEIAVHFTHLALVVMVTDLCFNRVEGDEEERRKAEVRAVLHMLESARDISRLLSRSLDSVGVMLRKHGIHLQDGSASGTHDLTGNLAGVVPDDHGPFDDVQMQQAELELGGPGPGFAIGSSFGDFWQTVTQGEPNLDSVPWDQFFSSLDPQPF
ncbi:Uu.00g103260.m01.CDS01 [Anthostomella pinea]|uniref:Uu.00g103260.m01.CDS01 n=1 Tax=Anthostomella pinea TaxID=933095 RepID=A0AAI8VEH6_9PEZI|nr:Uu.00g103260.m01.CDS01 [Anthostomella pinea]